MGLSSLFGGLGIGSAALGIGESLFGHQNYNQADQYLNDEVGGIGNEQAQANQYGSLAQQNLNNYNNANASYQQGLSNYAHYLGQNPYTSTYGQAQVQNMTNGVTANAQGQNSAMQSYLNSRGFSNPSSMAAGAQLQAQTTQTQALDSAANQNANNAINLQRQNQGILAGLYQSPTQMYQSYAQGDLGAQSSLLNSVTGQYGNLASSAINMVNGYNQSVNAAGAGLAGAGMSMLGQANMMNYLNGQGMMGQGQYGAGPQSGYYGGSTPSASPFSVGSGLGSASFNTYAGGGPMGFNQYLTQNNSNTANQTTQTSMPPAPAVGYLNG